MSIDTASERPFGTSNSQINKLIEQMQKGFYGFLPGETWTPAVNLYESELHYLVCVDLAGVVKDEIDLQVAQQKLTLRGNRLVPTQPSDGTSESMPPKMKVHLMEIDHGQFVREVELPQDVESDKIAATYRNGMLWIELPKRK